MREFPLAEILQFVSLGSRSGTLEIVRRDQVHGIIFTSGTITGLTARGWTLTQELRESQLLPQDILTGLITANSSVQDLRAAILTSGHMTADEWNAFVSRQVERLLYALFDARDGTFSFHKSAPADGNWLPVRISADRAVLEGTRWSETWSRGRDIVPTRESRFARTLAPPKATVRLSPTHWRVYVATERDGSLPVLAMRSVLTEVDVLEGLQVLVKSGLVQRVDGDRA